MTHVGGGTQGFTAGDAWGGLAASAVLLPQSMAFGVSLYAVAGLDAATGAYAGLAGTAALCLVSGLLAGTRGLISAPTGPVLILLGSAAGAFAAQGLAGEALLTAIAATIALAGVLQFCLGLVGGGRLIKYIPFPVVSGFMTGSAILMVLSQLGPLRGDGVEADWVDWQWLPAAAAGVTVLASAAAQRWLPMVPGPVAGLLAGTAVFHAAAATHGGELPAAWMIGALPGFSADSIGLPLAGLAAMPWLVVLTAATALALLASLDTLLTAVVADVATGTRHDSRRELVGQGGGQMLSALLGGMAGAGTTAATVIAIRSGGGRWTAVCAGLAFALLTGFAGEVGRWLPIGALAGVILSVAVAVADRDILSWARRGRTRQDAFIAVLVTAITVWYDLMVAVGVGVLIAVILFIRDQVRAPVVHRRSTAAQTRSIRARSDAERTRLDEYGGRIIVYELRGNLFFGTADKLIDELAADLDGPNWVILHLRRVQEIDLTAVRFLKQIAARLAAHEGMLLLCELHRGTGIEGSFQEALALVGTGGSNNVLTFNGRDEALEFAENALLDELGQSYTALDTVLDLADNAIAGHMNAAQVQAFGQLLTQRAFAQGEWLFRRGDPGDSLLIVLAGRVEVRLPTTEHHYKRLAMYGAGTFLGELALLKTGPRAADAIAITGTTVGELHRDVFERIKHDDPALAIAVLTAISDTLVVNQRWSTRELQRLAEW